MVHKLTVEDIRLKRAYAPPERSDGLRILVDRLWPRGIAKADAVVDHWMKELAPTAELRKWFGHDPARWDEFRRRFVTELRSHGAQLEQLRQLARKKPITLVYSAHDELHNDAVVLRDELLNE